MEHTITEEQKQAVLINIQRIEIDELVKYVKTNQITFEEMRQTGKLSRDKQDLILKVIEEDQQKKQIEKDFWEKSQSIHTISAYEDFLRAYPDSVYAELALSQLEGLRQRRLEYKERKLLEIKNNPLEYTPERLSNMLNDQVITKNELIEAGIITDEALRLFLNPPQFFVDQHTWQDLPPLPAEKTDVYFFGIPASGKSCVLAGLFSRAEDLGIFKPDIRNKKGLDYMNELKRCIKAGYVPSSTSNDTVNYISFSLREENKKREHPISVIEMSGEYFRKTYEMDDTSGEKSIGAKGFLNNDNKKVIYLVIDFFMHGVGPTETERTTQQDLFVYCLSKLAQNGTLKRTDAIHIIVTKSDLMPEGVDIIEYTSGFLNEQYLTLIKLIKELNEEYGINATRKYQAVFHPFSLGKFMLGKTFIFNGSNSEELLYDLINSTSHTRKKTFYNKLFKG